MKLLGAVCIAFLAVGPLAAQSRPATGFGNVVFPGLAYAPTGNPWGNIVTPAIPQGAAALASGLRYGSFISGFGAYGSYRGSRHNRTSGIYAFPVYVGGYGYGYGYPPDQGAPPPPDAGAGNQPAPPPVVINQYFGTPPPSPEAQPDAGSNSSFHFYQSPTNTDTTAPETSYYLIAFKDHTIYSAVAYYIDGDTLHYFTAGNVHNQVSLSLVDRPLTEQLNRQHNVDVHLP